MNVKVIDTEISGVRILEPQVFGDSRGYFFESWNERDLPWLPHFVQDNESMSGRGVIRGLHFQKPPYAQAKLVRVVSGEVLDVAVDLRKGSPTYGKHVAVTLSGENHRQLFIPEGFAHGFAVLSDIAVFQYKCSDFYHPESEGGIAWNDSDFGIGWGIPEDEVTISPKDANRVRSKDFDSPFVWSGVM